MFAFAVGLKSDVFYFAEYSVSTQQTAAVANTEVEEVEETVIPPKSNGKS